MLYPLPEVLLVVLCGTLAGAEDFVEIRRWGNMHQAFLRRLAPFKAGIPRHDTLNDVINALDGTLFAECFTAWVDGLRDPAGPSATPEVVAIDGKTSRRTHDRSCGRGPLHMVSAWASSQRLVLGQQACEAKSNEITAIPLLPAHRHGPQNMATVRHMAMNLLRAPRDKHSLKVRRKSAARDTNDLEALIRQSA